MDTQPKEQTSAGTSIYSLPKAERDEILRAAGIRPASGGPRRPFKPLRSRPTLRSIWHRLTYRFFR